MLEASYVTDKSYFISSVEYIPKDAHWFEDESEGGLMIYAENSSGTVFADDTTRLYKNKQEMVEEFRQKYNQYLPADFDYAAHLAFFEGVWMG